MAFKKNAGQIRATEHIKKPEVKELLLAAGSRSGKTFFFIYVMILIAVKFPGSRQLIARRYFSHAKGSIWLDTLPKVLTVCFPELAQNITWNNTDFFIELPNKSQIFLAGLDDKERIDKILGREYLNIFLNEASELDYDVYLTVKTRLAQLCKNKKGQTAKNMMFLDENPPSSKHFTKILFVDKKDPKTLLPLKNPERYQFEQIHPWENIENISVDYINMLEGMPPAQRRRFYEGKFGDGSQDALWTMDGINAARIDPGDLPHLRKIVVSIDPAVTAKEDSDETGIIVEGIAANGHIYTLADASGKYSPMEWAQKAVDLYHEYKADEVIGEVNNGGDLVETVIHQINMYIPFRGVHATKNKYTRAEPVAALMMRKDPKNHIVGELPELEMEMTEWEGKKGDPSPNRIDAKVWATFALLPDMGGKQTPRGNFGKAMRGEYSRPSPVATTL